MVPLLASLFCYLPEMPTDLFMAVSEQLIQHVPRALQLHSVALKPWVQLLKTSIQR